MDRRRAAPQPEIIDAVVHDLRDPLNVVLLVSQLLRDREVLPPAERSLLALSAECAERMARMLAQLLDYARVRADGGLWLRPGDVDLARLCHNVVEQLRRAHPQCAIALDVRAPARGRWDGGRLAELVETLVGNAAEHGGDAPVTVTLSCDGRDAILDVENGGEPIAPDELTHLFEPLHRATAGGSRHVGLGLFLAREIAAGHGGRISVASAPERGTRFTVRLPLAPTLARI